MLIFIERQRERERNRNTIIMKKMQYWYLMSMFRRSFIFITMWMWVWGGVSGGGRGEGFTYKDKRHYRWKQSLEERNNCFSMFPLHKEIKWIPFCAGKFQFCDIRTDLWLPCLFKSQALAPTSRFPFLPVNQPLGDETPHTHRPFSS